MKIAICLIVAVIATAAQAKNIQEILHYKQSITGAKSTVNDEALLTQNVCDFTTKNWDELSGFFKKYADASNYIGNDGKLDYVKLKKDITETQYNNVVKADVEESNRDKKIPIFYKNYLQITGCCKSKTIEEILHYKSSINGAKTTVKNPALLTQDVCKFTPENWNELGAFFKQYADASNYIGQDGKLDYVKLRKDLTQTQYDNVVKADVEESDRSKKIPTFYKNYLQITGGCKAKSIEEILHYKSSINGAKTIVKNQAILTQDVCKFTPENWNELGEFFKQYADASNYIGQDGKLDYVKLRKDLTQTQYDNVVKADVEESDRSKKIPIFYKNYLQITGGCKAKSIEEILHYKSSINGAKTIVKNQAILTQDVCKFTPENWNELGEFFKQYADASNYIGQDGKLDYVKLRKDLTQTQYDNVVKADVEESDRSKKIPIFYKNYLQITGGCKAKSIEEILHYKSSINGAKPTVRNQALLTQDVCKFTPENWNELGEFFKQYADASNYIGQDGKLDYVKLKKDLTQTQYDNVVKADVEESDRAKKIPIFYKNYLTITSGC